MRTPKSRLHVALGVIGFLVFILFLGLDGYPGFEVSRALMYFLGGMSLTLLGYGFLIETWLKDR